MPNHMFCNPTSFTNIIDKNNSTSLQHWMSPFWMKVYNFFFKRRLSYLLSQTGQDKVFHISIETELNHLLSVVAWLKYGHCNTDVALIVPEKNSTRDARTHSLGK